MTAVAYRLFGKGNAIYVAIALLIGGFSFLADRQFGNEWFQNCGAAIVLVAILMQNRALLQIIRISQSTDVTIFESTLQNTKRIQTIARAVADDAPRDDVETIVKKSGLLAIEIKEDLEHMRRTTRAAQNNANKTSAWALTIAVAGTAIWGYGNIFMCIFGTGGLRGCLAT